MNGDGQGVKCGYGGGGSLIISMDILRRFFLVGSVFAYV